MKFFKDGFSILLFTVLSGLLTGLSSCQDDELVTGFEGSYLGYFPLQKGYWVEYNADSIVHLDSDDSFNLDTAIVVYAFQIREEMDSSFYDAEGDKTWLISRYRRSDSLSGWTFMNLWTAKLTNSSAQRVEDNIRFIKLSFPLDSRVSWNGNAFNNYPAEDYSYDNIDEPLNLGSLSFDSTLVVVQNAFVSNINRIDKREIYAKNIGMVEKVQDSLNTVKLPNGSTVILNGTEYKMRILDYKR